MGEMERLLERWEVDERGLRARMYGAPTARERERWHALWLLARGATAVEVAETLERDPHTVGRWLAEFERSGPAGLAFEQTGGSPPPSRPSSGTH
jgi:transposase